MLKYYDDYGIYIYNRYMCYLWVICGLSDIAPVVYMALYSGYINGYMMKKMGSVKKPQFYMAYIPTEG